MVNYIEEQKLDDLFIALANDKRRNMVQTLAFRPATIGHLAAENGLSLPAMHKHVQLLERASLIVRRKVGRTNFVALNGKALGLTQSWLNQFRTEWSGDASLENYIAGLK